MAAARSWADLDGYCVAHGIPDPRELPLERFCNLVWYMMTRNAKDEAAVAKIRAQLWRPPRGMTVIDRRSPWSPENETKAFAALKSALSPK